MGKINFRKKYEPILRQLKKEIKENKTKLSIEQAKRIIAKTIIYVLDVEGEEVKKENAKI